MNKKIINTLEYNENNFSTNIVIQTNGRIYKDYISSLSHVLPSEIVPTPNILTKKLKI